MNFSEEGKSPQTLISKSQMSVVAQESSITKSVVRNHRLSSTFWHKIAPILRAKVISFKANLRLKLEFGNYNRVQEKTHK